MAAGYATANDPAAKLRLKAKMGGSGALGLPPDPATMTPGVPSQGIRPLAPGEGGTNAKYTSYGAMGSTIPAEPNPNPNASPARGVYSMAGPTGDQIRRMGGAAAPTVTPPAITDWSKMGAAPAVAPEMGPPNPQDAMVARRQAIGVRQAIGQRQLFQSDYLSRSPAYQDRGPEGQAMTEELLNRGNEKFAIDNASAPVQQPQGVGTIMDNRMDLRSRLLARAKMLNESGKPENVAEGDRLVQAADKDFAPLSSGQAESVQAGQRRNVPVQEADRNAWGERAGVMSGQNIAGEQFQREAVQSRAAIMRSRMATERATALGGQYAAEAGATPEVAAANQRSKIAAAQASAATVGAQSKEAQSVAAGAEAQATLRNPQYLETVNRIAEPLQKFGSGAFLGSDRGGEVASFQSNAQALKAHILSQPPEDQAALKRDALSQLQARGLTEPHLGFTGNIGYGLSIIGTENSPNARRIRNTQMYHASIRDLLNFLRS